MTPSRQPANGIKKLPWWICTLLFLATLINYLDRQTFAVATPAIVEESDCQTTTSRISISLLRRRTWLGNWLQGGSWTCWERGWGSC
jgi:hypothetical protein